MTFRNIFLRRRSLLIGCLCLLPILTAGFVRYFGRANRFFMPILAAGMIHGVVALISLLYGAALIGDEISSGTWVYLAVRPVRRSRLVLEKFMAYAIVSLAIVCGVITLICILIWPGWEGYLRYMTSFAAATIAYGAIGLFLGARSKRPILMGLLLIGWEKIASQAPGFLRRLTVMDYMLAIFPASGGSKLLLKDRLHPWYALPILIAISIAFICWSAFLLRRREISP
jgi:hypothetical protein